MEEATKPKWTREDAVVRGKAAGKLGGEFKAEIEPRLTPGRLDGVKTDSKDLKGSNVVRTVVMVEQKTATAGERDVAGEAADMVGRVRANVKKTRGMKSADLKSFGVGEKVAARSTSNVLAALRMCVNAIGKDPDRARRAGLLDSDKLELEGYIATLGKADDVQDAAVDASKDTTISKKALQLRVEAAVDEIATRGAIAFRLKPAIRERFEALISHAGPAAQDREAEEEPQPAKTA